MLKIIAVCGNGLGSSLIMEMAITDAVKDLNVDAEVTHMNLSSFTSQTDCDVVICAADLTQYLADNKAKKISLQNILDKEQIKKELKKFLNL